MKYKRIIFIPFLLILWSCSTMSFIPREGGAAKFNLATVDYVESQINAQNEEILTKVMNNFEPIIDSLLVEDRARLTQLESLLAEQEAQVQSLSNTVDSTYISMNAIANKVLTDISGVKRTTADLQLLSAQLSARMDKLSKEALQELQKVLATYLQESSEADQK
ncbi:MAG: hypothetical protein GXO92_06800 [FCB group bacterium]|nr:hypothetical protein [FCB group bacterium]